MFELSQLRCFVAVAEELHFGRAAARLNLTQPPLSRQIQLLEHALDVQLLERTSRVVRLSPAGANFLPEARSLLRLAESAALAARRSALGEAGTINLGFTAASGYEFLPRLITGFREEAPEIDLVLKEMVSADQIEALSSGRIDIGLLRSPFNRREFGSVCVVREPLLLAAPSGHRLAIADTVELADLDRENFVGYSPYESRYFYDLVVSIFAAAGVVPNYVQYMSQMHSILGLVRAGLGVSLVPQATANLRMDGVVLRDVGIGGNRIVELHLVWREPLTNPAALRLVEFVRSFAQTP